MPTEIHTEADAVAGHAWDGWGWSEPITPAAAEREARDAALSERAARGARWAAIGGTIMYLALIVGALALMYWAWGMPAPRAHP